MARIMQNRGQGLFTLTRIIIEAAAIFFITASLIDFGVGMSRVGHYLEKMQIGWAALTLTASTLLFWLAVTLIFGRLYCSTVCPMGALMDLSARFRGRKSHYHYSSPAGGVAVICLVVAAVVLVAVPQYFDLADPAGIYSRIVRYLSRPRLVAGSVMATIVVAVVGFVAYKRGRLLCNTVCPVGIMLGVFSRGSALRIEIDTDRCTQCRRCEHVCKSECINMESHVVDMRRCVVCFNCLPVCPHDAITYTFFRHTLSLPMMQSLKPTTQTPICNNTSTCSPTSSVTEQLKPTGPAPARSACSDVNCALISAKASPSSPRKSSISNR